MAEEVSIVSTTTVTTTVVEKLEEAVQQVDQNEIIRQEEEKLKAKMQQPQNKPLGHSSFLQKRLAKGQKYFDSGDYNMARQRGPTAAVPKLQPVMQQPTGDTIPTPESVPSRKTSILTSKLATPAL